jgi:hypothetical protein
VVPKAGASHTALLVLRLMRDRIASEVSCAFRGWVHGISESDGVVRAVVG